MPKESRQKLFETGSHATGHIRPWILDSESSRSGALQVRERIQPCKKPQRSVCCPGLCASESKQASLKGSFGYEQRGCKDIEMKPLCFSQTKIQKIAGSSRGGAAAKSGSTSDA